MSLSLPRLQAYSSYVIKVNKFIKKFILNYFLKVFLLKNYLLILINFFKLQIQSTILTNKHEVQCFCFNTEYGLFIINMYQQNVISSLLINNHILKIKFAILLSFFKSCQYYLRSHLVNMQLKCSICHNILEDKDNNYATVCGHLFHFTCLSKWMTKFEFKWLSPDRFDKILLLAH